MLIANLAALDSKIQRLAAVAAPCGTESRYCPASACRAQDKMADVPRRIAAIDPGDTAALEALLPNRWPPILSTDLTSGKKNPVTPRLVAVGSGRHVGSLAVDR